MEIMNDIEQKAWDKYKEECGKWELAVTSLSRATKHREQIEFSLPILWKHYYSLCDEVAENNRKIRKIREEVLTTIYKHIPQKTEEEETKEYMEELEEEIRKLSSIKCDSWYYAQLHFDELRKMIKYRLAMQDDIDKTKSRLEKVRSELSQINEETLSLR